MSLVEPEENQGMFIDLIFCAQFTWIWTADMSNARSTQSSGIAGLAEIEKSYVDLLFALAASE
jgi:hypothetical protein